MTAFKNLPYKRLSSICFVTYVLCDVDHKLFIITGDEKVSSALDRYLNANPNTLWKYMWWLLKFGSILISCPSQYRIFSVSANKWNFASFQTRISWHYIYALLVRSLLLIDRLFFYFFYNDEQLLLLQFISNFDKFITSCDA